MSRRTVIVAALGALLATAVGLVIVLARESSAPADRYERLRRLATRAHAGMYVPAHETATITGAPITLAEVSPGRRQLLFFLTTSCPYCRASLPAWGESNLKIRRMPPGFQGINEMASDSGSGCGL